MRMLPPATRRFVPELSGLKPATSAQGTAARLKELDAARAMLMLLGLVVHAANPYAAHASWIVTDGTDQAWLHYLGALPHQFRMPGFFLLAGFLGTLALKKHGAADFLRRRATRLLWPLVTSLLTINALQYWYVRHYIAVHCGDHTIDCAAHATPGLWVAHLWFLFYLSGYSLVHPLIVRVFHWAPLRTILGNTPAAHFPLTVAIAAPFLGSLVIKACASDLPFLYQRLLGVGSLFEFATYGMYFGVGVLVASWPRLRQRFVALPIGTALLISLSGVATFFAAEQLANAHGQYAGSAPVLWMGSQALLTLGCLRLFMRLSHWLPALATRIADSTYTVYLFHHFLVILLALALVDWPGRPGTKFLIVVVLVGLCSYQLHRLVISRSRLLRRLFNGAT